MRIKRESLRILGLAVALTLLTNCAPKELQAPCDPLALVVSAQDDCGPEKAINVVALSWWLA